MRIYFPQAYITSVYINVYMNIFIKKIEGKQKLVGG